MRRRRIVFLVSITCCFILLGIAIGVSLPRRPGLKIPYADIEAGSPGSSLVTILHYLESGRQQAEAFLSRKPDEHREQILLTIERCRAACVRINVTLHESAANGSSQVAAATGVLVADGKYVLTAGHAFEGNGTGLAEVVLVSGHTLEARVVDAEHFRFKDANHDWAVLEIVNPDDSPLPSVTIVSPEEGAVALIFGYPDGIGVDASNHVAYGVVNEPRHLEPLLTFAFVEKASPILLQPVAGFVPIGGSSGGPVFNDAGALIGIFVSVNTVKNEDHVRYSFNAASIDALPDDLLGKRE